MSTITKSLIWFAISATVLTFLFRFTLSYGIENNSNVIVILSASLYAITMAFFGWLFSIQERKFMPFYDVGFRFHLTTFIIHNVISEIWFLGNFQSKYEDIITVHLTSLIWGIFVFGNFIFFLWNKKNSINNLDKKDLFE